MIWFAVQHEQRSGPSPFGGHGEDLPVHRFELQFAGMKQTQDAKANLLLRRGEGSSQQK
jgi:hypothetical protein